VKPGQYRLERYARCFELREYFFEVRTAFVDLFFRGGKVVPVERKPAGACRRCPFAFLRFRKATI